jgi:hypothetical protein
MQCTVVQPEYVHKTKVQVDFFVFFVLILLHLCDLLFKYN